MNTDVKPAFLRRRQAAAYLGMSESWLRSLHSKGRGPEIVRIEGAILYPIDRLEAWARERLVKA